MLDPIFQITYGDIKQCLAQYQPLGNPTCDRLLVGKGANHQSLGAACWPVPHPPYRLHQYLQEKAVGNHFKSLGKIQVDNVTAHSTTAKQVSLSLKMIRFVKYDLPLVNPCSLFPITFHLTCDKPP